MLRTSRSRILRQRIGVLILSLSISGCAAVRTKIHARSETTGPISLTSTVYDSNGNPLRVGKDLKVVGHVNRSMRVWSMFFGAIPLSGDIDLGNIANEEMAKVQGQAVVNVTIEISSNGTLKYLATLLPILPVYLAVTVDGDVVRTHAP